MEKEKQKKKVVYKTVVNSSKTSILIGDLAKLIKQSGYDIGQNRLFCWLRENGYLIKLGERKNMPTQKSMELGLFEIEQKIIENPNGIKKLVMTPKVTIKGQMYFCHKFK